MRFLIILDRKRRFRSWENQHCLHFPLANFWNLQNHRKPFSLRNFAATLEFFSRPVYRVLRNSIQKSPFIFRGLFCVTFSESTLVWLVSRLPKPWFLVQNKPTFFLNFHAPPIAWLSSLFSFADIYEEHLVQNGGGGGVTFLSKWSLALSHASCLEES